jgi:5-oxoprolinase (ATP-hydrolysing) subunit A
MTQLRSIDLNADMGESPEALASGRDAELMRHISSVNIACGGHAGDEKTIRETLKLAKSLGVVVGAHPSYPDRANFGRISIEIEADVLYRSLFEQIQWFFEMTEEVGVPVRHVKPHGALYHAVSGIRQTAAVLGKVIRTIDPNLLVVVQAGSAAPAWYDGMGLSSAEEAFADRAYEANGTLRDRKLAGALLQPPECAAAQALDIVLNHRVRTFDGGVLPIKAETLCVHSDTPGAADIAAQIRKALAAKGVHVQAL